ncbi:hypothetical protein CP533_1486 [Ophiocordyceps camponoti-saundersi (nom. inval.)]|nr:hypothetical protein CP533_1486 [Ophiocordyceps camponoti-saundersi (nom. inval.)]
MNSAQQPPDRMRSANTSPTNTVGQLNNGETSAYLSNAYHYQHQTPRLPQLTPRDAQRPIDQELAQPHTRPHPHAQASSLASNQHQHNLQQYNMMQSSSQIQPPPPSSESSCPRQVEAPPVSYPSTASHQGSSQITLAPLSKVDEATGRKYQLDVVQQPKRARMCGFGDKQDRRPITPPPCVRLIITDAVTGTEIDCKCVDGLPLPELSASQPTPNTDKATSSIDHSMFVLNVDLWNQDGTREVNLVRSSTGSPSISSTTPYSYTTLNAGDAPAMPYSQHVLPSSREPTYNSSQILGFVPDYQLQAGYVQASSNGSYVPAEQFFPQHQGYREDGTASPISAQVNVAQFTRNGVPVAPGFVQEQNSLSRMALMGGHPQGMFTRNLIGSLAASAFRLSDTSDHIGIWFVLQDLSVRTEGSFRLRFSFVNVGARGGARRDCVAPRVNTGRAPILASCFSDVFSVYSAKKFPGVCESTPLSKTFATQGIKIPIRKDANIKGGDDDEYVE